jgi:hypothetical protein
MSFRSFWLGALCLAVFAVLLPVPAGCQSTCTSSAECGSTDYCSIPTAACLTPRSLGFCKARPESCTDVVSPVCGCDSKTYPNSCQASLVGVAVAANGECAGNCGGLSEAKCGATQFCDFAVGACAQANPSGTCATPPDSCSDVLDPVCGCDGRTYDNDCKAKQLQVSIASLGNCPCGGPNHTPCEEGRYCELAVGACLGPNPSGVCKAVPSSCSGVQSPVCGCDGKTYPNLCTAAQNGVSVTGTQICNTIPDGGMPDSGKPDSGGTGGFGGGGD